jgi:hypothetical protein
VARLNLRDRLIECARAGVSTNYSTLAGDPNLAQTLDGPLTELMAIEHSQGRPLLSVLCVRKRSGLPGPGFYKWAKAHDAGELGCPCGGSVREPGESERDFYLRESAMVFEY